MPTPSPQLLHCRCTFQGLWMRGPPEQTPPFVVPFTQPNYPAFARLPLSLCVCVVQITGLQSRRKYFRKWFAFEYTCVSFLTEDINEDIRIRSAAADFAGENTDHVFVDCKEGGRNPNTSITQWFDAKHNNTDQCRLCWCYLESMTWTVALGTMTLFSLPQAE